MINKKGQITWIILAALVVIALGIGYLMSAKIIDGLGSKWLIGAAAFVLLIVFRQPVIQIFEFVFKFVTSILKGLLGVIGVK